MLTIKSLTIEERVLLALTPPPRLPSDAVLVSSPSFPPSPVAPGAEEIGGTGGSPKTRRHGAGGGHSGYHSKMARGPESARGQWPETRVAAANSCWRQRDTRRCPAPSGS